MFKYLRIVLWAVVALGCVLPLPAFAQGFPPPANLTAAPGDSAVFLNWTASPDAVSYTVKRSKTPGGPYTTVATADNPPFTEDGLSNGVTYYYVVSATSAFGDSANSNEASATPIADKGQDDDDFQETFDAYASGSGIIGQGGWDGWDGNPDANSMVTGRVSLSQPNSLEITGTSDMVHTFSKSVAGQWTFSTNWYVSSQSQGNTWVVLLDRYASGAPHNGSDWGAQISANAQTGLVTSLETGATLPLRTDQWVELRAEIDLEANVVQIFYNNVLLAEHPWVGGVNGPDGKHAIEAVDLFSETRTALAWHDNIGLVRATPACIEARAKGCLPAPIISGAGSIANGDFLIHSTLGPVGDGNDEVTDWTMDFSKDPCCKEFLRRRLLCCATLALTVTPHNGLYTNDRVYITGIGAVDLFNFTGYSSMAVGKTSTVTLNLLSYFSSTALLNLLTTNGCKLAMQYQDDAIISYASMKFMPLMPLTQTVSGSVKPAIANYPGTVTNGGFVIQSGSPLVPVVGDGNDEYTQWTFNFSKDPCCRGLIYANGLCSAHLKMTISPKNGLYYNDSVYVALPGTHTAYYPKSVSISTFAGYSGSAVGSTITIDKELIGPYTSAEIVNALSAGGCNLSFAYQDDAIVSYAELTLVPNPTCVSALTIGSLPVPTALYPATVANGGFTIQASSPAVPVVGDGNDEYTYWRFDFTKDPCVPCLGNFLKGPLCSAKLTLTLTPKNGLYYNDSVGIVGYNNFSISSFSGYAMLAVGKTCTIERELITTPASAAAILAALNANGGTLPMFYQDDSIVSLAQLTLKTACCVNMNTASPLKATGTIALEGVPDLSAISQAAALDVFHVSFRQPGTTQEVFGQDVTLDVKQGSPNGTYGITDVADGTYDVWIKGSKNLAVLVPNVHIDAATGGAIPNVLLPAADANGDNSVDASDFGQFVSAYNTTADDAGSGYDASCDFNFDGAVDATDFGLLVGEYNSEGAP